MSPASEPSRSQRFGFLAAAVLVLVLQIWAIGGQSLVGDAPYHLLAGHQALRYGENRLNLEHPPLVKLVAALPLLAEEPLAPPITVDRVLETSLRLFDDPERLERVQWSSRLLVLVLFGLPFLVACFALGRRFGGPSTGWVLALGLGLSIPVLPILTILQTDTALALGFTSTMVAAAAFLTRPDDLRAGFLGCTAGLALAAKFSGVLLGPSVLLVILLARLEAGRRLRALLIVGGAATVMAYLPYAVANRDYDREMGRDTIRRYCAGEALIVDDLMRPYQEGLLAVEDVNPSLAQWLTGLVGIRLQNEIGVYPSYAFGTLSSQGRWWFFPVVLLVRLPLLWWGASCLALWVWWKSGRPRPTGWTLVLLATVVVFLGMAVGSNYNLGIRHLLPVLPLLLLPAAHWVAGQPRRTLVFLGLLALESVVLAPLWMSATNTWWLGSHNPSRFALSAGAMEYRQNFRTLHRQLDDRGIDQVGLLFPLVREEEIRAYLPRATVLGPNSELRPGWYAVNVTAEQFLSAVPQTPPENVRGYEHLQNLAQVWTPLWQAIREGEDHGYLAATFHLYYLPSP